LLKPLPISLYIATILQSQGYLPLLHHSSPVPGIYRSRQKQTAEQREALHTFQRAVESR